jgi:hypothetical protein
MVRLTPSQRWLLCVLLSHDLMMAFIFPSIVKVLDEKQGISKVFVLEIVLQCLITMETKNKNREIIVFNHHGNQEQTGK